MKTILYMAISANGFIAKPDGDSTWTSDEGLAGFYTHSKDAGNVIFGKNTYDDLKERDMFPFPDVLNVVFSTAAMENPWGGDKVLFTDKTPQEVLDLLEEKKFRTAFLAGGGQINASFLEQGLVDEIYLDVEPVFLGKGIPVIAPVELECDLKLIETKKLNENTIQLHYEVVK